MINLHISSVLKSLGALLSKEMDSVNIESTVKAIELIEFSIKELQFQLDEAHDML